MRVIQQLRERIYENALKARPTISNSKVATKSLQQAKTIGIFFPADKIDDRNFVIRYAEKLRKQGKKVKLLGFIPTIDREARFDFHHISNKDLHWLGRYPKGEQWARFSQFKFDATISLFPQTSPLVEFVSLYLPASFKIGPYSPRLDAFDLMIDAPNGTMPKMIQHYEAILDKSPKAVKKREPVLA